MWSQTVSIPPFYNRAHALAVKPENVAFVVDSTRAPGMPTIDCTVHFWDRSAKEFRASTVGRSLIPRLGGQSFIEGEQPYLGGSIYFNSRLITEAAYEAGGNRAVIRLYLRGFSSQISLYTPQFAKALIDADIAVHGIPVEGIRFQNADVDLSLANADSVLIIEHRDQDGVRQGLARCTSFSKDLALFLWLGGEHSPGLEGSFSVSRYTRDYAIIGKPPHIKPEIGRSYLIKYFAHADELIIGEAECLPSSSSKNSLLLWNDCESNRARGLAGTFSLPSTLSNGWAEREI